MQAGGATVKYRPNGGKLSVNILLPALFSCTFGYHVADCNLHGSIAIEQWKEQYIVHTVGI